MSQAGRALVRAVLPPSTVATLPEPFPGVVYAIKGGHVATVLVGGRVVMRHEHVVGVDESEVMEKANALKQKILQSLEGRSR